MHDECRRIALQHIYESRDVIGIGVRGNYEINRAVVPRHDIREAREDPAAWRSAIDEGLLSRRRVDKDRVALPDIKEGNREKAAPIFTQRRVPDCCTSLLFTSAVVVVFL